METGRFPSLKALLLSRLMISAQRTTQISSAVTPQFVHWLLAGIFTWIPPPYPKIAEKAQR